MPDLLLELFSEEIPARMQARAADDLKKLVTDRLRGPHEPGSVEDPAAAAARKARISADIPARRLGTPEEFGQICAFLCSVHAGYLTGQNIPVDGDSYVSAF